MITIGKGGTRDAVRAQFRRSAALIVTGKVRALSFAFSFVHFLTRGVGKKRARFHYKQRNGLTKSLTWSFAAALTASALSTTEPAQAKPEGCPGSLC